MVYYKIDLSHHDFLLYVYSNPLRGDLRPIIAVDRHILVTEITSPILGSLPVRDTQINQDLQILLCEQLGRTSLVDIRFRLAVGQQVERSGIGGSFGGKEGDGDRSGGDCTGGEIGVSANEKRR